MSIITQELKAMAANDRLGNWSAFKAIKRWGLILMVGTFTAGCLTTTPHVTVQSPPAPAPQVVYVSGARHSSSPKEASKHKGKRKHQGHKKDKHRGKGKRHGKKGNKHHQRRGGKKHGRKGGKS
jgi:hypothetical protein